MNFRGKSKPEQVGFQLAPMIDVMFLLLCFFVVSQIYAQWETEIDITLPTAQTGDVPDRMPAEIIVNVRHDGNMVVNKREFDQAGLANLLQRIVDIYPGQPILIRADQETAYKHVVGILDLCRQCDIWNISFATTATEE
ncbi:MAG: biopolymer transporter ExbD [Planctomycetes bacterium]|nr:biopolymer transporter ExbD [Planctomycetota bacterium]